MSSSFQFSSVHIYAYLRVCLVEILCLALWGGLQNPFHRSRSPAAQWRLAWELQASSSAKADSGQRGRPEVWGADPADALPQAAGSGSPQHTCAHFTHVSWRWVPKAWGGGGGGRVLSARSHREEDIGSPGRYPLSCVSGLEAGSGAGPPTEEATAFQCPRSLAPTPRRFQTPAHFFFSQPHFPRRPRPWWGGGA